MTQVMYCYEGQKTLKENDTKSYLLTYCFSVYFKQYQKV